MNLVMGHETVSGDILTPDRVGWIVSMVLVGVPDEPRVT